MEVKKIIEAIQKADELIIENACLKREIERLKHDLVKIGEENEKLYIGSEQKHRGTLISYES